MKHLILTASLAALLTACSGAENTASKVKDGAEKATEMAPEIAREMAGGITPAAANPDKNAYFGDLHIHTKNSFDAYIFNIRVTPDDAYKFGRGAAVKHPLGYDIQLDGPPLDFMAVTDHIEYMGILPEMNTAGTELSKLEMAKDMFSTDPEKIVTAFGTVGGSIRSGKKIESAYKQDIIDTTWNRAVASADKYYVPGEFTTFAGYEYTAVKQSDLPGDDFAGGNLHRNVIFKDSAPTQGFGTLQSNNPEDLWVWLDKQRAAGNEAMAIPHNSNVSNGEMFALQTYEGNPLTSDWAKLRIRNEPLVELTQVKGTSETHPMLSPNDEFANFEIYEDMLSSFIKSKTTEGDYVRQALGNGVGLESTLGTNPFKVGLMASSDTHMGGGAFDENRFWSKIGILDGTPETRGSIPPGGAKTWDGVERDENAEHWFSRWSAAGLAGVWAEENTRESIYGGMKAKETFGTSGPRIKVRFFASNDYDASILGDADMVSKAYAGGVPMGGDIETGDTAPTMIAWATRDPRSSPLQRLQIIKAWSEDGKAKERIFDVACSDGSAPDAATRRCADNGASVDVDTCKPNGKGAPELRALWQDPEFNASMSAAYYVRVIENPTCRWSTYEANRAGVERHPDRPETIQERAWSSPIWTSPK